MLRTLLFAIMGIAVVGFLGVIWIGRHQTAPVAAPPQQAALPPPPPVTVAMLAAARDIQPGSFLQLDDLVPITIVLAAVQPGAERDDPATRRAITGALVLHPIPHLAPIAAADLLLPGAHGFLASILKPGMRAYTIERADMVTDAGLISPGDRLDIILTQTTPAAVALGRQVSAQTVLTSIRVLAVDQQLFLGPPPGGKSGAPGPSLASMTVEVTPAGAERLAVAVRLGRLAFSLRPARTDAAATATTGPVRTTWAGDVMSSLNKSSDPSGPAVTMHVFEGAGANKDYQY